MSADINSVRVQGPDVLNSNSDPVPVSSADGYKNSYSAAFAFTPAGSPTDVLEVLGSNSKTVRISRVIVQAVAGAASTIQVYGKINSAADSGGTKVSVPAIPHDSSAPAATATINKITANPTTITTLGFIRAENLWINIAANGIGQRVEWIFGGTFAQAVVLRGTSQGFAVNLNGQTMPASLTLLIAVEWTEE